MQAPIIQKVISSRKVFVERRLGKEGKILVEKGSQVRPFDFVAEVPPGGGGGGGRRLTAGVGGEVVKLMPGKAVLIQTAAVTICGVAGRGEDSEGDVRISAGYDEPIRLEKINSDCAGGLLVGGYVSKLEVFKKAGAVGVRGIVCGGTDFAAFDKINLPTLVIEGFGRPPLNRRVFDFLKEVEGRHVFLSPEHRELLVAYRRDGEIVGQEVTEPFAEVKVGIAVQVFAGKNFGRIGKVKKVVEDMVEVDLDGDEIIVPERNVGIIK
jgi:hypothetical protein